MSSTARPPHRPPCAKQAHEAARTAAPGTPAKAALDDPSPGSDASPCAGPLRELRELRELRPPHPGRPPRILLAGVFGPFGVDDAFGRKENIMELFHNQVTRGQDLASFRFHHRSFGLYFLAANVDADVTVLDFPSRRRFEREVGRGYDLVGISFIAPNFDKAREMARITRQRAPEATLVLGGHGAAVDGVAQRIDCDHVVRGEGIRWLREHLGQDPDAPIVHPTLPASEHSSIYGIPLQDTSANLLVPGVGCVNGCRFCSTSHFFGRQYTPFLSTGKELFEVARRIADETGTDEFFVQDENFLKDRERALELIEQMERHQRYFSFHIFSSAETIRRFGVENLERLGVTFLWIGVESSSARGNYEKNTGLDAGALVSELRRRGIIVLASGILCAEHHTRDNIQAEIDFMVGLEADFVQFMLLTPLPVTALYRDHQQRGLLRADLPLAEWHGQKHLSYHHPEFPGDAAQRWIDRAFRQEYQVNSSSLYRATRTVFQGHQRLARLARPTAGQRVRRDLLARWTRKWAMTLPTIAHLAVNDTERRRALALERRIRQALPPSPAERLGRRAALALALAWKARVRLRGDGIQPATLLTRYRHGVKVRSGSAAALRPLRAGAQRVARELDAAARVMLPRAARAARPAALPTR